MAQILNFRKNAPRKLVSLFLRKLSSIYLLERFARSDGNFLALTRWNVKVLARVMQDFFRDANKRFPGHQLIWLGQRFFFRNLFMNVTY